MLSVRQAVCGLGMYSPWRIGPPPFLGSRLVRLNHPRWEIRIYRIWPEANWPNAGVFGYIAVFEAPPGCRPRTCLKCIWLFGLRPQAKYIMYYVFGCICRPQHRISHLGEPRVEHLLPLGSARVQVVDS